MCQPSDESSIELLDAKVQPYRPEDQPAVEEMYRRAAEAERNVDPHFSPMQGFDGTAPPFLARWVVTLEEDAKRRVAGTCGLQAFYNSSMATGLTQAQAWLNPANVVELRHVRVDPEVRGQGVGFQVCQTAIKWARDGGIRRVIVNTTSPQIPALNLYRKLRFLEVGRCFFGPYELVWSELVL